MVTDEGLGHPVQLLSCHTGGDPLTDLRQRTRHQLTVDPQEFDLFLCFRPYHFDAVISFQRTYIPDRPVRRPVFINPS